MATTERLPTTLDSTDINKLWMKGPNVINQQLHDATSHKVAAGHIHLLRVAFRVGSTARGGGVNIVGNEINVVITPPMLPAAFAGVSQAGRAASGTASVRHRAPRADLGR